MIKKNIILICFSGLVFCLFSYVYFSGKLDAHRKIVDDLEMKLEDKLSEIEELKDVISSLKEKQKRSHSKNRTRSRVPTIVKNNKKEAPVQNKSEKPVPSQNKKTTKDKFAEKVLTSGSENF